MPVAPTYPGVYIEEVSSGVRTITGVSTSVTAFIGYTARGPVNRAVRLFNFGEFQRQFGGLTVDSQLSYALRQFFQNGGSEAIVVRVAAGAQAASVTLRNDAAAPVNVLTVRAASEGTWGNTLRIDVDYDTLNPHSLFNFTVLELVDQAGRLVPGRTEVFRNLSMNSFHPSYAAAVINGGSEMVRVERPVGLGFGSGTSTSRDTTGVVISDPNLTGRTRIAFSLDGGPREEVTIFPDITQIDDHTDVADAIDAAIELLHPGAVAVTHDPVAKRYVATATAGERSSIQFFNASSQDAAAFLGLGQANGGVEVDGAAAFRPMQTGIVGTPLGTLVGIPAAGTVNVEVMRGTAVIPVSPVIPLNLWGAAMLPPVAAPTTHDGLLALLRAALATSTNPTVAGSAAQIVGGRLRVTPPAADPDLWLRFSGGQVAVLGLALPTAWENVARYTPGVGETAFAQLAAVPGTNGTPPGDMDLRGIEGAKTGLYALENTDLFNLLCILNDPHPSIDTYAEALAYCERRRAFLLVDVPPQIDTLPEAEAWITTTAAPLRHRNAAAYFPWMRQGDPLMSGVVRAFPPSGAVAGLFARTDSQRGVWKAPAGTEALVNGAVGLAVTLTDMENGVLNRQGLNCLRTFPVIGTVVWGARTLRGADVLADEWKYVPIRRLALFLEESLYRGTQWVVFEPNDEPLWARIRLNLNAFMMALFRQGAFQGSTPRDAFYVKCDGETTTQGDRNLGIVNIEVGFAPLKPAEFVIIRIQQIAGDL